jgi:hypothetical protein
MPSGRSPGDGQKFFKSAGELPGGESKSIDSSVGMSRDWVLGSDAGSQNAANRVMSCDRFYTGDR